MRRILYLISILISYTAISQPSDKQLKFDSIHYQISVNAISNPNRAIHLADSIFIHTTSNEERVKALMLMAKILEKEERRLEGIEYALKALEICRSIGDYNSKAEIYIFLSAQSRNIGFYDEGKHYLRKGIEVSSKIKNATLIERFGATVNHELAEYAMEDGDYEKAIEHLNLAKLSYEKEKNNIQRNYILANVTGLIGRCHMGLRQPIDALESFSKAKDYIEQSKAENSFSASLIYQGLGEMYLENGIMDSAGIYLHRALDISEPTNQNTVKEAIYGSMARFYREEGQLDSFAKFTDRYNTVSKLNQREKKNMINGMYRHFQNHPEESTSTNWWILGSGLLLVIAGSMFIITNRNRQLKQPVIPTPTVKEPKSESENTKTVQDIRISKDTEENIRKKLDEFVKNKKYLKRDISFPRMASLLNTNAKYLNHYLKVNFNKDYTTYINDLRIIYILDILKTNPAYRKYKISYLAKSCGFSSHSNFSANFKRVTHISPSEFINKLQEENDK